MHTERQIIFNALLALGLSGLAGQPVAFAQSGKEVVISRKALPVAVIRDKEDIQFFVNEYFISEDRIDSMEVFDMNESGFDDKDVLKIYPSGKLVGLNQSETALDVMRRWRRTNHIELVGQRNEFDQIVVYDNQYPVAREMHAAMVRMVEELYNIKNQRLSLFFEFDDVKGIAALRVWGFRDRKALQDTTRKHQYKHDLLFYTRTDTLYLDKPIYDVIYIEQTKRDTVYIKEGE